MSTKVIALAQLATRWSRLRLPSPERLRQLQRSLSEQGQLMPLLGYRGDTVEIVDGFKRLEAARHLGWSSLTVHVLDGDAAQAKVAIASANARSGMDELEQAWLVRSLHRDDGWTQPQIGRHLGRHKSWVCRRLALVEQLETSIEADLRLGLLCAAAAREIVRLPRGNQRAVADQVIQRALTSRQTARFVDEAIRTDRVDLDSVLGKPTGQRPRPQRPRKTVCEKIIGDIVVIQSASARLQSRLHEPALGAREDIPTVVDGLKTLDLVLLALRQTIGRIIEGQVQS